MMPTPTTSATDRLPSIQQEEQEPNKMEDDSSCVMSEGQVEQVARANQESAAEEERKNLARSEDTAVSWLRVLVLGLLLLTAVLVCFGVYWFTRQDEKEDFEKEFTSSAAKLVETFHESVERRLGACDTLSVTITSYAMQTGATFPNVTMPNWALRGMNSRIMADSPLIYWLPLVTDEMRPGWEAFAAQNHHHLMTDFMTESALRAEQDAEFGYEVQPSERLLQGEQLPPFNPIISGMNGEEPEGSGPFLPLWQMTPILPVMDILNFNVLSHPAVQGGFLAALKSALAVIDVSTNLETSDDGTTQTIANMALQLSQYRHDFSQFASDPSTAISYPVFDSFESDRKLAGLLTVNLHWSLYFENILPPSARGYYAVLENTLNQTFTYRVDGSNVVFLGNGDLHETEFDDMGIVTNVAEYLQERASPATSAYKTVGLHADFCAYTIRVYPSSDTEADFVTNKPVVYTAVVGLVFFFTSVVFLVYDLVVQRRQRIVMARALASGAIVSNLFPREVRERLYIENKQQQAAATAESKFLSGTAGTVLGVDDAGSPAPARPIANLFQDTTVFFGDLAGFTEWSNKRSASDVFELLEAIYSAFDAIASKRNVYKIETIGDCYVAVTGIPEEQPNHAVIMAKFARECVAKMQSVTQDLVHRLGEDTIDLKLRVGLHSGETTAGVLRGKMGRFQLFGDTVNTASRMESLGMPGRIHLSEATAQELMDKGKGHWLTLREDKVVAKGKGEMTTYWMALDNPQKSIMTSVSSNVPTSDHSKKSSTPNQDPTLEERLAKRLAQNTSGSIANF